MLNSFQWVTKISLYQGIIALAIFLVFLLARKLFTSYFLKLIAKISKMSKNQIDDALFVSFKNPIAFFLAATGLYLALSYLPIPHSWRTFLGQVYQSATILSIGWGFYIFSDAIGLFFNHMGNRLNLQFNEIVIPFLSKVVKFIVVVITLSMVLDQWHFHVTGLITGLGIGGLAIAMAAKDTLSNLFGGFMIITDSPFTIGDSIKTPSVEGTVEDINFRSTKIRTADQALVTVPNSTLATQPVTNLSKMEKRLVSITIKLDIGTPKEKLLICIEKIRRMLTGNSDINQESILVYFDQLSTSSLDLLIQFYSKTADQKDYLQLKEKCNLGIIDILAAEAVHLAQSPAQVPIVPDAGAVKKKETPQQPPAEKMFPEQKIDLGASDEKQNARSRN